MSSKISAFRILRIEVGITAREFAREARISYDAVNRMERGENVKDETLWKAAAALAKFLDREISTVGLLDLVTVANPPKEQEEAK